MASATGIPDRTHAEERGSSIEQTGTRQGETEPLLGRPGDVAQTQGASFLNNLVLGTGLIAQTAVILLLVLVWTSVFTQRLMLFSGHPLAQSLAVFTLVQSILTLQPTHTADQKRGGRWIHAFLNLFALFMFIAGVVIIEYNKIAGGSHHFKSVHGYLGVITSIIIVLQYLVGFTMWATPSLYGGEERAKAVWKYHRFSGYTILVLLLATICSATLTGALQMKLWATVLLSVLILAGVFPRIQKQKLGFPRSEQ